MQTKHTQRHHAVPLQATDEIPLRAKAGEALWEGSLAFREIATGLAVPGADTGGITFVGLIKKGLDNTGGADGVWRGRMGNERWIIANTAGVVSLPTTGTAPKDGQPAHAVDNETVTADATTQSHRVGVFVRPCEFKANHWQVRYSVNA